MSLFRVSTIRSNIKQQVHNKNAERCHFTGTQTSKKAIYHDLLSSHTHHTQKVQITAIQPENDFTVHGFYNICHDHCHQPTQSTIYSFQTLKGPLTIKKHICNHKKQFLASLSSTAHLSFYLSQQQSTASKHAWAGGMRGAIE